MDKKETFGGEIAKQLPVKDMYNDLFHPALNTVGQGLQGATKLALTPISALVWGYDKIADYLDVAIPEYFEKKKIEKEKIISPDPTIAVPIVEAMKYTSHKEELREMFTNLLGAAMNADSIDAHPAFVDIIKQLSSDEGKIIKYLYQDDKQPMMKFRMQIGDGENDLSSYFSDVSYKAECQYPQKFPEYLDNLHRLGIVEVYYDRFLADERYYDNLKLHPQFPVIEKNEECSIVEKKSMYELSEFGKRFCEVCLT